MSELTPIVHPMQEVDSFVVVTRRQTTNGTLGTEWATILQKNEPDREVTIVATDDMDEIASGEAMLAALQHMHDTGHERPLLVSAGGDGAFHYAAKRLLLPDTPPAIKRTLLTPWDLGFGNDNHANVHNHQVRGTPLAMFSHPDGHVLQTNPLEWEYITPDGRKVIDWSVLYGTLGATGEAAVRFLHPGYRAFLAKLPPFARKAATIAWSFPAMFWPEQYQVHIDGSPKWSEVVEVELVNGERMAINGDFSRTTHLGDRAMHLSVERQRNLPAVVWFAGRMAVGHPQGERRTRPFTMKVRDGRAMPGQLDGEPFQATAVRVQPGPQVLNIYATRDA